MLQTNERDVSYSVLNFGGVFYEGRGIYFLFEKADERFGSICCSSIGKVFLSHLRIADLLSAE